MSNRTRWIPSHPVRTLARAAVVAGLLAPLASCTSMQTEGESPAYLIINSLNAASGAEPDALGGILFSDVLTLVDTGVTDADGNPLVAPTIFEDTLEANFSLALKDPGSSQSPTVPTSANVITITRYRVDFARADGRNTPGVDVPYGFDGAATVSVGAGGGIANVSIVRQQAKREAPLAALANNGGAIAIATIATVTFYGHDQAGRAVSVTGQIGVHFADWGDPN